MSENTSAPKLREFNKPKKLATLIWEEGGKDAPPQTISPCQVVQKSSQAPLRSEGEKQSDHESQAEHPVQQVELAVGSIDLASMPIGVNPRVVFVTCESFGQELVVALTLEGMKPTTVTTRIV